MVQDPTPEATPGEGLGNQFSPTWSHDADPGPAPGTDSAEDRDRTAQKLKVNEAKLRAATALVGLAVYSWDPVSEVLEWDDRVRAMWGVAPGERVDWDVFARGVHPDDRARVDAAVAVSLDPAGNGRYDIEFRIIGRDDGVERWVSTSAQATFADGKATDFIGAVVDISEKRRAEAAIRASEAQFRAFARYSANLIWIVDSATGVVDYRSPAYEQIWGEAIEDAPRGVEGWLARIHPDDVESVRAAMETLQAGEPVVHEYRIIRPDGAVRELRDTCFPIRDEAGRPARVAGIIEDRTLNEGNHVYLVGKRNGTSGQLVTMLRAADFQVRCFDSAAALLDIAPMLSPGCVLIDLRIAATGDIRIPRALQARSVRLPAVVIGSDTAPTSAIVAAMKAGAADYLIPPADDDAIKAALASALAEMHGGDRVRSTTAEAGARVARLTPREREVLEGLVNGGTNKTIAKQLGISPRTVELYRSQVMNRLGASNLPELIQIALAARVRPRRPNPSRIDT